MADTAAHLVDRVLPRVPIRQWVLSLPFRLRYRLAYDSQLTREVLQIFLRAIFTSRRRCAKKQWNMHSPQCGAVTFIQRFGGAINLNVHFHSLVFDGVFDPSEDPIRFRTLPPPDDLEVARVAARVARRIGKLLERRALDGEEVDGFGLDQPLLAALYSASVRGRIATGSRAGQRVLGLGDRIDVEHLDPKQIPRCASIAGLSVHANVAVPANDRQRLERLCRYAARPPIATDRLEQWTDGRVCYELKHRWRNGATHVVFEGAELVEKLAALVPPPRFNLVRYHGVLAPQSRWRNAVVGGGDSKAAATSSKKREPKSEKISAAIEAESKAIGPPDPSRERRYAWAELMRRVFEVDVLECPRCHRTPMRILAAIHPPQAIQAILQCLGIPTRAPPVASAAGEEPDPFADPEPFTDCF